MKDSPADGGERCEETVGTALREVTLPSQGSRGSVWKLHNAQQADATSTSSSNSIIFSSHDHRTFEIN